MDTIKSDGTIGAAPPAFDALTRFRFYALGSTHFIAKHFNLQGSTTTTLDGLGIGDVNGQAIIPAKVSNQVSAIHVMASLRTENLKGASYTPVSAPPPNWILVASDFSLYCEDSSEIQVILWLPVWAQMTPTDISLNVNNLTIVPQS